LTLHVCVSDICDRSTDQEDSVGGDAETRAGFGPSTRTGCDLVGGSDLGGWVAGDALQAADFEALEDFSCFVRVANIFEGFGCVLTADVEEDFFTAPALQSLD
jgi:hypothetical protein